jgi:putative ABC transport system permease protein
MRNLGSLARTHVAHRPGRAIMAAGGIVLGVAMFVASQASVTSLLRAADAEFAEARGTTDVQVTPNGTGDAVLPAEVTSAVTRLPSVRTVAASLDVPATAADGSTVGLVGLDEHAGELVDYRAAAGRLPDPGTLEVAVAADTGLQPGVQLVVFTPTGEQALQVVGVLVNRGPGAKDRSDAVRAYTSLTTAQSLAGRGPVLSSISVALADGVSGAQWADDHEFDIPGTRIADARAGIFGPGLTVGMSIISYLCLLIGGYLIYVTMTHTVAERVAEIGTLRALGARRRDIRRVVRAEAIVTALMGGAAGSALGIGLGALLSKAFGALTDLERTPFVFPVAGVVVGVAVAVVVTLLGSLGPSRRAARLSPVVAMRGDVEYRARIGRGWIAGVVVMPLAWVFAQRSAGALPMLMLFGGAAVAVRPLFAPLARVVGPAVERLAPGVGRLTVLQAIREKARSAGTLAVVMLVLGFGMGLIWTCDGILNGLERQLAQSLQADVEVAAPRGFPPATVDVVRHTPGVGPVSEQGYGRTFVVRDDGKDLSANLFIIDPSTFFDISVVDLGEGTVDAVRTALAAGGAAVIPKFVADDLEVGVGDTVMLRTTHGPTPFQVAGIAKLGGGPTRWSVIVGTGDGRAHFGMGAPTALVLDVAEGANADQVAKTLRRSLHAVIDGDGFADPTIRVASAKETHDRVYNGFRSQLLMFEGVAAIVVIVAMLGLANTLGLSVLQRRRELGLLRAVGARSRQVARSVTVESVMFAAIAFLLALPLGFLMASLLGGQFGNAAIDLRPPLLPAAIMAVAAALVAVVAAWGPARRASKLTIVDAIRFD